MCLLHILLSVFMWQQSMHESPRGMRDMHGGLEAVEHAGLPKCSLDGDVEYRISDDMRDRLYNDLSALRARNKALNVDTITPITFAWNARSPSGIHHAMVACAFLPANFVANVNVTLDVQGTAACFGDWNLGAGCTLRQFQVAPFVSQPLLFVSFGATWTGNGIPSRVAQPGLIQAVPVLPSLLTGLGLAAMHRPGPHEANAMLPVVLEAYRTDNHDISILQQLLFVSAMLGDAVLLERVLRYAYEPYRHRGRVLAESLATSTTAKLPRPLESSCDRPSGVTDLRHSLQSRSPPSALVFASFPQTKSVGEGTFSSVTCGGRSGDSSACLFKRVCIGPGRRMRFYSHGHQECETDTPEKAHFIRSWAYTAWHGHGRNFSEAHHVRPHTRTHQLLPHALAV